MRPGNNSTSGGFNGGLGHRNSPVPYLLAGLGLMLVLIAIAVTILSCSCRKSRTTSAGGDRDHQGEEKSVNKQVATMQSEMEPKIVVIMAGDDNPTYLAKPTASS
ncbi:protein GLUTAMINE DUMPER 2-like [Mangifera indica]|uniref:protein GLUTAMINE DUMPER 2-like n=1 Tax=Mangifera indica TaxID=29780 RepID=UPI001CFA8679|nr:protein GLUTAMINE DUMPER 2-like [Mangifera indica]